MSASQTAASRRFVTVEAVCRACGAKADAAVLAPSAIAAISLLAASVRSLLRVRSWARLVFTGDDFV